MQRNDKDEKNSGSHIGKEQLARKNGSFGEPFFIPTKSNRLGNI